MEMTVKFEMSLMIVKGSIRMTIPKPICKNLNLKPKQKVLVSLTDDNKILIEPRDR